MSYYDKLYIYILYVEYVKYNIYNDNTNEYWYLLF